MLNTHVLNGKEYMRAVQQMRRSKNWTLCGNTTTMLVGAARRHGAPVFYRYIDAKTTVS